MPVKKTGAILSIDNHDRDAAGLHYVYPVLSRRSSGVSLGINLNPNNACNWHCVYCQVPDLICGSAPHIDLDLLKLELRGFLHEVRDGKFMREHVPEGSRRLSDVAISGNGEPTSSRQFCQVIGVIEEVLNNVRLAGIIKVVLITNGSYMRRKEVQSGLKHLMEINGEVWFKIDRVRLEDVRHENGVAWGRSQIRQCIEISSRLCPTWIQTCMHAWDGMPPDKDEIAAYLDLLQRLKRDAVSIRGVLLYGLARPSMQTEARHLSPLNGSWMNSLATRIRARGYTVTLSI